MKDNYTYDLKRWARNLEDLYSIDVSAETGYKLGTLRWAIQRIEEQEEFISTLSKLAKACVDNGPCSYPDCCDTARDCERARNDLKEFLSLVQQ